MGRMAGVVVVVYMPLSACLFASISRGGRLETLTFCGCGRGCGVVWLCCCLGGGENGGVKRGRFEGGRGIGDVVERR